MKNNDRRSVAVMPVAMAVVMLAHNVWAEAGDGSGDGKASPKSSFYKEAQVFSTCPDVAASVTSIDRFGPVGMGIELHQPAFVMKIQDIEEGSPAAATGKLKAGQIIESINGAKLADIDPRIQLGNIITRAEEGDGVVKLVVRDAPSAPVQEVEVRIPVLGSYSRSWPLNCPKSDKIVRHFAEYLAKPDADQGFGGIGMLFLLSTGEDKDLEPVRKWVHGLAAKPAPNGSFHLGYGGIPLAEYYLRTGDAEALPVIQKWVDMAVKGEFLGGWSHRDKVGSPTYGGGGGNLNAGGTAIVTFLMLAKECGANVPEHTLHDVLVHFYRWAGRGNNPYGDNRPDGSFVDNGKNGNLAFAMAAAASLTPDGETSLYAAARDVAALSGFYTGTFMLHGHTGGGIGEVWRSAAMGLLYGKKPDQYRSFMDNRRWHYELSRRWDGTFGILGGARYDDISWGAGYALTYTIPRKTLRITGAASKFAKPYRLPARPWGTAADDVFLSLEAAPDQDGKRQDLSGETLDKDSAKPLIDRLLAMGEAGDDVLARYVRHPDMNVRRLAANNVVGIKFNYMWATPGDRLRPALLLQLIRSKDPRVRHAVLAAISTGMGAEAKALKAAAQKGAEGESPAPAADEKGVVQELLTREVFDLLIAMIKDPQESWLVKDAALTLVGSAPADWVAPQVDCLIPYLKHEEWWLQNAALVALSPVVADERCYRKVLPAIGEFARTCTRYNASGPLRGGKLTDNLREATPEVLKLAAAVFKDAYAGYEGPKTTQGGQDITKLYDKQIECNAELLVKVPGCYDLLYETAKKRFPNDALPHDKIFLDADFGKFGPELKKAIVPLILDKLVYEYIGLNRQKLLAQVNAPMQAVIPRGVVDGLTDLYRKAGVFDYDWHPFGPDLKNAVWDYLTFDPPEQQEYDVSPWRYRKVTYPQGMANWFRPEFDPAKAGWKKGQAPFGQYQGMLVTNAAQDASGRFSREPMRTFWDKEVLLLRGTFKFPALKPGYLYRVQVGTGINVGDGDGYRIYINGKLLVEAKAGIGRREGGHLRGGYITPEFIGEFNKGEVTIAATTFLRWGHKAVVTMPPVPQGVFSLWIEEMKCPPLDAEALRKSAAMVPMRSAEWQSKQDPDNAERSVEDDTFRYDGRFSANAKLPGTWIMTGQVASAAELVPGKKLIPPKKGGKKIVFRDQGLTDNPLWIWSGDVLMDLARNEALKMEFKMLEGEEYLLIESGGFSEKNSSEWKTPMMVMKKQ